VHKITKSDEDFWLARM